MNSNMMNRRWGHHRVRYLIEPLYSTATVRRERDSSIRDFGRYPRVTNIQ